MRKQRIKIWECWVFPIVLLLYPLRHINWGLDLWDTGYNYGNFMFMGTEHMDPMWLFSTYLANVAGWLLTKLPFGDTLMGMNFYTGLFVSALALIGYGFCIKKLEIPFFLVFLGEMVAVSLCWCPTAVLYNYLTYLMFLLGTICLYLGLKDDRNFLLVLAGVCLGTNVLVRFSNLPEAAMILAVWAYAVICRDKLRKTLARTGWCMLGYLGALGTWLLWISLRYGFTEYVEGIIRLFGMTETATDYTPYAMILGLVWDYIDNLYWVVRLFIIVLVGVAGFAVLPDKWIRIKKLGFTGIIVLTVLWLYTRNFCSLRFYEYNAMLRPGILFLMAAILTGLIQVFRSGVKKEEKLISGMVVLIVLLTSLGSNNKNFPSLNNLFLAGPYVFWMMWRFVKKTPQSKSLRLGGLHFVFFSYPVKAVAMMFLAVILVQGIGFGAGFVFVEAEGARNVDTKISNNRALEGIYMSKERAQWMEEISDYVNENGLEGKEVLLYGRIPSMAFYLNMPPAFNSWSDLPSFSLEAMEEAMEQMEEEIRGGGELPLVLLERNFYENEELVCGDQKFDLIREFMEGYDYQLVFSNDKFLVYQAGRTV